MCSTHCRHRANKAQCVTWLTESKSIVRVQQNFHHGCRRKLSLGEAIGRWFDQGQCEKRKSPARLQMSEDGEKIEISCQSTPKKSVCRSWHLGICNKTGNLRITELWSAFVQPLLQWKSNEYYTTGMCVFVALGIQQATRKRHVVLCGLPRSTVIFHITS
jgi:hypothetical protein